MAEPIYKINRKRRAQYGDLIMIEGNESGHYFYEGQLCQVISMLTFGSPSRFKAQGISNKVEYAILSRSKDYVVLERIK